MTATMSILGLYNEDPTILDAIHIPDDMDLNILASELLSQCAELEIIYPDPVVMKTILDKWSTAMLPIWQNLYDTTQLEYDPIANYDRRENWTDTIHSNGTNKTNNSNHAHSTAARTGFNVSEGQQPSNSSDSQNTSEESSTAVGDSTSTHIGTVSGNIGVTTTQQMIQAQREVVKFNVYQQIINDFEDRFCLMIY